MFSDDQDTSHMGRAVAAGVCAYMTADTPREHIHPVIEVAMARFQHEEHLRQALAQAQDQLQERKVVDRAKGLLMAHQGLSEPEAYARLRKTAMNKGLKLADMAQRLIDAHELLS
jgi:response regulator NasT